MVEVGQDRHPRIGAGLALPLSATAEHRGGQPGRASPAPTLKTLEDPVVAGEAEIKTGPFGTRLHASDYVEDGTPVINVRNIGVVMSAIGANRGKTWYAQGKWSRIKNTIRFWSRVDALSTEYLFFATDTVGFWPRRGAAQPFVSQSDAQAQLVICPPKDAVASFTQIARESLNLINVLNLQSAVLRQTRDLLPPKLISGELNVEQAESDDGVLSA